MADFAAIVDCMPVHHALTIPSCLCCVQGENVNEPNFGCKAVQREWDWSGRRSLLARACMRDLLAAVQVRRAGRQGCRRAHACWMG